MMRTSGKWLAKFMGNMGSWDSNATNHAIGHNFIVLNPNVKEGVEGIHMIHVNLKKEMMMKHRSHVPVVGLDMFGWESLPSSHPNSKIVNHCNHI